MRLAKTPFTPSWLGVVLLGMAAAAASPACGLNPQPLPPGDTPDGAAGGFSGDASATTGDDSGGGGSLSGADAAYDGSATTPADGGADGEPGASDAGDASAEDASSSDAGDGGYEDSPADAPTDVTDEGE